MNSITNTFMKIILRTKIVFVAIGWLLVTSGNTFQYCNCCFAQDVDQIQEQFYHEISELYGDEAADDMQLLAPQHFEMAMELYYQVQQVYQRDGNIMLLQENLKKSKTQLEHTVQIAAMIKNELGDLIQIRKKAREIVASEQTQEMPGAAEDVFQRAIVQAENDQIRVAVTIAHDAEELYRKFILTTIQDGPLRDMMKMLEGGNETPSTAISDDALTNYNLINDLIARAQSPDISTREFIKIIDEMLNLLAPVSSTTPDDDESNFVEEHPAWNLPDLAITRITIEPARANPGDAITITAAISNHGTGLAQPAILTFTVNDVEVARENIDALEPNIGIESHTVWQAETPGRHYVRVELIQKPESVDNDVNNNFQTAIARVSGMTVIEPEMEFDDIDFRSIQWTSEESAVIPLRVRNVGFGPIERIPIDYYIDGERVSSGMIDELPQDENQALSIPWQNVTPGQHVVTIKMELPDYYYDAGIQQVKSWDISIPDRTVLYNEMEQDKWVPIGPALLSNGSVGRMDRLAFHPTKPNIMYATAPSGGVWKTTDRAKSWKPVADRLPSLTVRALAVDPRNPDVIYISTVDAYGLRGHGIFKSLDGGSSHWDHFIDKRLVGNVDEIFVRYTATGRVMIYASSDNGVWRYIGNNPKARHSVPTEWVRIKNGRINDLAVDPANSSILYASVAKQIVKNNKWVTVMQGLYRTTTGESATGDADWGLLRNGLPLINNQPHWLELDVYKKNPKILYAAVNMAGVFYVYRSENRGNSWKLQFGQKKSYNDFIRIDPTDDNLIYLGGVKLLKAKRWSDVGIFLPKQHWYNYNIRKIHDDMKSLEFDPFNPGHYYIMNDGGIWYCEVDGIKMQGDPMNDRCSQRNNGLQTTQFYDFDASATNPNLMIGGTQDNGTIMYDGKPIWKEIKGGDGNFAVIAPGNKYFYAQHQKLKDDWGTSRCEMGVNCSDKHWHLANRGLPKDWGWDNAYFTKHPTDPKFLLSQGDQVYMTSDGGKNWSPRGPKVSQENELRGFVRRTLIQPQTNYWIAGTSRGQIWYSDGKKFNPFYDPSWHLVFQHPNSAEVKNMALASTNDNILFVVFSTGAADASRRIYRIHLNLNDPVQPAMPAIMSSDFPKNLIPNVIAGDGHDENIAYVGIQQGGVYRWDARQVYWKAWSPYNNGLPQYVYVKDMLVDPVSKQLRIVTWGRGAWSVVTRP